MSPLPSPKEPLPTHPSASAALSHPRGSVRVYVSLLTQEQGSGKNFNDLQATS